MGDTVCRIDPVFGQGMSIAVLEALALQKLFQKKNDPLHKMTTIFHQKVAKIISPIWNIVITEGFRYPGISGRRPIALRVQQGYSKTIFVLFSQNQNIYNSFIKVIILFALQ